MGARKTRGQLLAEAMEATVVEDFGYRAIIHTVEHGFLRYHVSQGLQKVTKSGKQWRLVETILTAEDVDKYLVEIGLLQPDKAMLDLITEKLGGEIVERFAGGGGVFNLEGLNIRYSPITGMDFVNLSLTKWVRVAKILYIKDLAALINTNQWETINGRVREHDYVRAHRGRSTSSDRKAEETEGPESRVSEEA